MDQPVSAQSGSDGIARGVQRSGFIGQGPVHDGHDLVAVGLAQSGHPASSPTYL